MKRNATPHRHARIYRDGKIIKDTIFKASDKEYGADWMIDLWSEQIKKNPSLNGCAAAASGPCVCNFRKRGLNEGQDISPQA